MSKPTLRELVEAVVYERMLSCDLHAKAAMEAGVLGENWSNGQVGDWARQNKKDWNKIWLKYVQSLSDAKLLELYEKSLKQDSYTRHVYNRMSSSQSY